MGHAIRQGLRTRIGHWAEVVDIRGRGLMIGIELDRPCGDLVGQARDAGLLINVTADSVVRLLPSLNITQADVDTLIERLTDVITRFLGK
jgi:acetylornithine aminotransferase